MATATRNQVVTKILGLIQNMTFVQPINNSASWKKADNRLRLWSDVPSDQQPAAFLVSHREIDEYRGLGLVRRRLEFGIWCYSRADNSYGSVDLDTMMETFEQTFNVIDQDSSGNNTLGGLVYWCRIEGRVFKDPGDVDHQAMLIVPLIVEMP